MSMERTEDLLRRRLEELAGRGAFQACFSAFLSPPEAAMAQAAAGAQGVAVHFSGGYEEAERCMACFCPRDEQPPPYEIAALEIAWPHQTAPTHRDLLGAAMGLGLKRACLGDIVLEADRAFLFAQAAIAQHIAEALSTAGHTHLKVRVLDVLPQVTPPQGRELRLIVSSLRLDAVAGGGYGLSRATAQELIRGGRMKLRHRVELRPDAHVTAGDTISARGFGRLRVEEILPPTKKGRLPLRLTRYGESRKA